MKITLLTEAQFNSYAKIHSSRNYMQTIEFAHTKKEYKPNYLGFINEDNNTLMGATLLLEKNVFKFKIGYVPGSFLIDYSNDNLFKDFIISLKNYLKKEKFIYIETDNITTYKMFNKNKEVIYYDTNIIKMFDNLNFVKSSKIPYRKVVLETEMTTNETYKMFNNNTKRNINLSLRKAITIYKDEHNNIKSLLDLDKNANKKEIESIMENFQSEDNKAEIYFAKIDPEKYINNYRYLLKKEDEKNDRLNAIMQDINIKKSNSFINKKMISDKQITKYNNEIIKATNIYTKYSKGTIIGAMLIIKNNREIYFMNEARNLELSSSYSSHLIKWEIIKKYLGEGYKIFNFGPINSIDNKDKNYLFKIGFGGKVYESIGKYDLIINKILYRPVKLITKFIK